MKLPVLSIKKIAVFRALQLGDMLCIIPAMRMLRHAYPSAHITLLGLPWAKQLVLRFPEYFDDFIHFPGYPGLPEQPFKAPAFLQFLSTIQNLQYDLVLQMQGNGNIVNPMVELFNATNTAGYFYKDIYHAANGLYLEYPEGIHEIERHLRLMEHLGLENIGTHLEFPLFEADFNELKALNLSLIAGTYVCIHPGSRGVWRQWPPAHFAAVADYCYSQNLSIVLTGTSEELDIINQVTALMKHEYIVVAGKTTIGAMGVLIKNARLLVSNCTGVSHIAAALEIPSIVISMDGEPERWGPLNHQLHRTIDWTMTHNFSNVMEALKKLLHVDGNVYQFGDNISGVGAAMPRE